MIGTMISAGRPLALTMRARDHLEREKKFIECFILLFYNFIILVFLIVWTPALTQGRLDTVWLNLELLFWPASGGDFIDQHAALTFPTTTHHHEGMPCNATTVCLCQCPRLWS